MPETDSADAKNYITGIYWQKSKLNGRETVPVILSLIDGTASLTADGGTVFSLPANQLKVDIRTPLGNPTISITVPDGTRYTLVTIPTSISPKFSDELIRRSGLEHVPENQMQAASNWAIVSLVAQHAGVPLLSGATGVAAAINEIEGGNTGYDLVEDVQAALAANGVAMTVKKHSRLSFRLVATVIFSALLVSGIIVWLAVR